VEVWLQVTREQLAALLEHPPPGWEQLLAHLAHRIANSRGGPPNGDPTDRLPSAALRRWINIRGQARVLVGCRVSPPRCDQDHTVEHANGGPASVHTLAPACKGDHLLRHGGGWGGIQHNPGHVTWTSPLGHQHERTPPPGPDQ